MWENYLNGNIDNYLLGIQIYVLYPNYSNSFDNLNSELSNSSNMKNSNIFEYIETIRIVVEWLSNSLKVTIQLCSSLIMM